MKRKKSELKTQQQIVLVFRGERNLELHRLLKESAAPADRSAQKQAIYLLKKQIAPHLLDDNA